MTSTTIKVTTYKRKYKESCYSLLETVERVIELKKCSNVIGIDIISQKTGELLYKMGNAEKTYVSETFAESFYTEWITQIKG